LILKIIHTGEMAANPPILSNGNTVGHSNYMRVAWATKGVEYIKE
jgi:hypothetical protein